MMAKITVNKAKCIGCGACAATCSEGFEMREGKANVLKEADCSKAAESGCPVGAISVS